MKKNIITFAAVLGGVLLLSACSSPREEPSNPSSNNTSIQQSQILPTRKAFSYQLVTSAEWMTAHPASSTFNLVRRAGETTAPTTESEQEIQSLLTQLDVFANNDEDAIKVESLKSDKEEYQYLDEITYIGLSGENTKVSMYYNIVQSTEEDDEDDDNDEDEKEDKEKAEKAGETEEEYALRGIFSMDGKENFFVAEREIEKETDEFEEELETRIFTSEDQNCYIQTKRSLSQESEEGENETEHSYSYEIVESGKVVESFSLEHEVENGEEEIEIFLKNGNYLAKMEKEDEKTFFVIKDKSTNTTSKYVKTKAEDGSISYKKIG